MITSPRIVFMGTAEFGVPALVALNEPHDVCAVVTAPDKPAGRGLQMKESAIKEAARSLGIETILQPESLKDPDFADQLRSLQADIFCVIAFRILPRSVYSLASRGAFNIHASLLPKFRGAAPINHAIMAGEKQSGVTAFLLNDVVDTGNILLQRTFDIPDGMTAGEMYWELMPLAGLAAYESVQLLCKDQFQTFSQDDSLASPAPKVWREQCVIDWTKPARTVRNFIHGLSPTPCAWTTFNGERLKIYRADNASASLTAGQWRIDDTQWLVGCDDGALSLTTIQVPGKAVVKVRDFVRGYRGAREGRFE